MIFLHFILKKIAIFNSNKFTMKKLVFSGIWSFLFLTNILLAQSETQNASKKWRLEVEPLSFIYKGFGGQIMYKVSKKHDFNIGLYSLALDVPDDLKKSMFENVPESTSARLGFELAAVARYKIPLFKTESNPVIGAIVGWEYFKIDAPGLKQLRIETFLATAYVGYELYLYKQMLYVNPQLRGVAYISPWSSDSKRTEKLKPITFVPTLSLGIRL
jgi:hypothetical protein